MTPQDYRDALKRRMHDLETQVQVIKNTLSLCRQAEVITAQAEGAHAGAGVLRQHAAMVDAFATGADTTFPHAERAVTITVDPIIASDLLGSVEEFGDPAEVVSVDLEVSETGEGPTQRMRASLHPAEAADLARHMRAIADLMEIAANRAAAEVMADFPIDAPHPSPDVAEPPEEVTHG